MRENSTRRVSIWVIIITYIKFLKLNLNWLLFEEYVNTYTEPYVKSFLNDNLGGWPMVTGKPNRFTPLELLKKMYKYMLFEFVTISIWANPRDPLKHIIKVT